MNQRAAGGAEILIDDLSVSYNSELVLEGVTGRFAAGSATAVIGPNGAGKSTLLKAIVGLLPPRTGSVRLPAPPEEIVGYLPQRPEIDRRVPLSCIELVTLGLWRRTGTFRSVTPEERGAVEAALATVGLEDRSAAPIGSLSIGQFQRALFARLLVQDTPIILLDEPFAAIDSRTTEFLLALLSKWRAEGRTVVTVLHDIMQARRHFPETLSLDRHVLGWGPTEAVLGAS
jgi:zinc/manganese transport system ATP-binding protein